MCDRQMLDVVEFLHKNKGLFACTQKQEEAWANWMGVTQPHSGGLRQILNDQNIANPFRFRAAALLLVPDLQQCLLEPNLFYWPQSSGNYIYKAESELYRRSPEDLKSFFADLLRVSVSYWNQSGEDSSSVLRGYQNAFVLIIQATEGERAQLELLEAFLPYVFLSPGFSQTVHFEYRWTVKILASRACEKVKDAMISYFQKQLLGENQCEASAAYFTTARSVAENTEIEIEPRCRLITKMLQFVLEQEVVIGWYDSCAKQLRGLIPYRFLRRSEAVSYTHLRAHET